MTVRVNKSSFNIREKLSELERPIGLKGSELIRSETAQEARDFVSAGRKNLIINGDMRISQRYGFNNPQTVINNNSYYLDRFIMRNNTSGAVQVRQNSPGSPFINSMQINVTSTDASLSSNEYMRIQYYVEGNDMRGIDWGQSSSVFPKDYLTLSFWVKTNKPGDYHVNLENTSSGYFPLMVKKYKIEQSDVWQKVVVTFPPPGPYVFERNNGIGLRITWALAMGSLYTSATDGVWRTSGYQMATSTQTNFMDSTSNFFYITGVQLEVGKNATEFEHRSYGEELALCERYCQGFPSGGRHAIGNWQSGTAAYCTTALRTAMRATPTLHSYAAGQVLVESVAWYAATTVTLTESTNTSVTFYITGITNSGQSANANAAWGNGASAVIQAEL